MTRSRLILLIGTGILQALGVLMVSAVAFTLFQLDLGTSAVQNAYFLFVYLLVLTVGIALLVLGHRIRKAGR
jgi:hypothetical protein